MELFTTIYHNYYTTKYNRKHNNSDTTQKYKLGDTTQTNSDQGTPPKHSVTRGHHPNIQSLGDTTQTYSHQETPPKHTVTRRHHPNIQSPGDTTQTYSHQETPPKHTSEPGSDIRIQKYSFFQVITIFFIFFGLPL